MLKKAKTTYTKIEFYLYINDLWKFKNKIFIQIDYKKNQKIHLEQRKELHEDIFYQQIEISNNFISQQVKYRYIIEDDDEEYQSNEFNRYFPQFQVWNGVQYNTIIFDTPDQFSNKQKKKEKLSDQILAQQDKQYSLLMFVQQNSRVDMLSALDSFMRRDNFKNEILLLEKFQFNLLQQMQHNIKSFPSQQYINLFSREFLTQNSYLIYQYIVNFQNKEKKKIEPTHRLTLEFLSQLFTLQNWIDLYIDFKDDSLYLMNEIIEGMETKLKCANNIELENVCKIVKVISSKQESIGPFLQQFWKKYFDSILNSKKIDFLIAHSQDLLLVFSQQKDDLTNMIRDYFREVTMRNEMFDQFIQRGKEFIEVLDPKGEILKCIFNSERRVQEEVNKFKGVGQKEFATTYNRLRESQQLQLYLFLMENKIKLDIDMDQFLFSICLNADSIEFLTNSFAQLLSYNPFLSLFQPLIHAFKFLSFQLSSFQAYKYLEYKKNIISIVHKQYDLQSKHKGSLNKESNQAQSNIEIQVQEGNKVSMNSIHKEEPIKEIDLSRKNEAKMNEVSKSEEIEKDNIAITKDDIDAFSQQLDEIIMKQLSILHIEDILRCLEYSTSQQQIDGTAAILQKVITLNIERNFNNNTQFISNYENAYKKYKLLNIKIDSNLVQLYQMVLEQFEAKAIEKYQSSKQISNHFSDKFTYLFLIQPTEHKQFKQLVLQDLQNLAISIVKLDIIILKKLFQSEELEKIFNYFEKYFQCNFSSFKYSYQNLINIYDQERVKLSHFFARTNQYFQEDYKRFQEQCIENLVYEQINPLLCSFQQLQILYEFYNTQPNSIIFQKLLLLIEEKQKLNKETQINLNNVFYLLKLNLIEMAMFITNDINNCNLLQDYAIQFQGQLQPIQNVNKNDDNNISSSIQINNILANNNGKIFENEIISIKLMKQLAGNSYQESLRNIQQFLFTVKANYQLQQIDILLRKVFYSQFLYQQGNTLINLAKQFNIDFTQRDNQDLNRQLQKIVGTNNFFEQSVHECTYNIPQVTGDFLQLFFDDGEQNDQQLPMIEKLQEILTYMQNKLKLSTFLDLRDLIEEDNSDIISLLIKLNDLSPLFLQIIQLKSKFEKSSFMNLVKELIIFARSHMANDQVCFDIEECVNNFYKVSNISQTFNKKKQFISLICEILEEGVITFSLENASDIHDQITIKVESSKQCSEQEIRSICSRVILEQNMTTNILIASAQSNILKKKQLQSESNLNCLNQIREQRKFVSLQSKKFGENSDNNNLIIEQSIADQAREQEELEENINELKVKMQKFRDQWFEAEQIKEILCEMIEYGKYSSMQNNLSYDNRNDKYQQTYDKMQNDCKLLKAQLIIWKQQIENIFSQHPLFTLVGFIHYKQLIKKFANQPVKFTSDLNAILKFLENNQNHINSFNMDTKLLNAQQDYQVLKYIGKQLRLLIFILLLLLLLLLLSILRLWLIQFFIILFLITKVCTCQFQNSHIKYENKGEQGDNANRIFQVRYSGSKELIQILIAKMQFAKQAQHYFQFFYYDKYTKIQDFELFLYRYKYLSFQANGDEYFVIFHQKMDFKFFNKAIERLAQIYKNQSALPNSLNILISNDIEIGDISLIPSQTVEQIIIKTKQNLNINDLYKEISSSVNFYYSDYPGTGKSFQIQQLQEKDSSQNQGLRIPTNGNGDKIAFLNNVRKRKKSINQKIKSIHLDLYETPNCDINMLLFELIFLKSISIHSNKLVYLGSKIKYFIEISNSLNQEFLQQLQIREYFKQNLVVFNIKDFSINHNSLSNKDKENLYTCYKYLTAVQSCQKQSNYLDTQDLQKLKYSKDINFQQDFSNLLQNLFLNKLTKQNIQPCFYQLTQFIKLFGSEMAKFEQSDYLKICFLDPQLLGQGIRSQVLQMSYNLCLNVSINKLIQSEAREAQQLSKERQLHNKAQSIEKFNSLMMNFVTFQEQANPCLTSFFDKIESTPKCIMEMFTIQKETPIFFDQKNSPQVLLKWLIRLIHQNESYIYTNQESIEFDNIQHHELQKTVKRITIQKDNFFKIAMIFMRIRSNSPVIIMGQSGIGKTALIELMALIMDSKFLIMAIHAGIQEQDVITFVEQSIANANSNADEKIILFFDEVNTNKLVGGLFKEILVDRYLKGVKLPSNIIPIAAINPYKLKSDKQKEMINLYIHGGIKKELVDRIKNTDLEYMVEPIPESMYSFIWNFDSLNKEDEQQYIQQMVLIKNQLKSKSIKYKFFKDKDCYDISQAILVAQETLRKEMGYQSACSLRDVSRFTKLLFWFIKTLGIFQTNGLEIKQLSTYGVCLTFYINYCVRLPLYEKRQQFIKDCAKSLKIEERQYQNMINDVLTFLINQAEVPPGIVKNSALKQNVFTLFVSIMNKIPVVLIGPPGCSKTLSLRILIQSMKGKQSKSQLFRSFKALIPLFYQGHIQSTSERILEVFDNAKEKQKKIEQDNQKKNYLSLVYMEEIGLAEISPHNPLKVLHSTLEKPTIAFASISNWPLDQSKMNRMLSIFRLDINEAELVETIQCIQDEIALNERDNFIRNRLKESFLDDPTKKQISQIYLNYLKLMKQEQPKYEQFHGFRDFYGMIKLLCQQQLQLIKSGVFGILNENVPYNLIKERIIQCYYRHFSGLKLSKNLLLVALKSIFFPNFPAYMISNLQTNIKLIEENLSESSNYFVSRNLMIIKDNTQFVQEYIGRKLGSMKKPYQMMIGSDFRDDQSSQNSYQIINQIISCVESGITVIIQNLDNVYQSLYELLNQNYRHFNGKSYCKISFGADSSNIEVAPEFKLILLVNHSQIHRMDGPLLNRFEKHLLEELMTVNEDDKERISTIMNYFNYPKQSDLFSFSNLEDVVQSLVIQQRELGNLNIQNTDIIQMVYQLSSLTQCLISINEQDQIFKTQYINSKIHCSFSQLVQSKIISQASDVNQKRSKLITIYSPTSYVNECQDNIIERVVLSEQDSQQAFVEKITNIFKRYIVQHNSQNQADRKDSKADILLVIADLSYDSYDRIILSRQKISEAYALMEKRLADKSKMSQQQQQQLNVSVILLIRTINTYKILSFWGEWEQYYIEDLSPLDFINNQDVRSQFEIQNIIENKYTPFTQIINLKMMLYYFISISESITNSYRKIQYKQINRSNYQTQRLVQLWEIFCSKKNKLVEPLITLCLQITMQRIMNQFIQQGIVTVDDFLNKQIIQRGYGSQTSSLAKAIWNCFNDFMLQSFSLIIYLLEKNNLIYSLFLGRNNEQVIKYAIIKILHLFQLKESNYHFKSGIYQGEIDLKQFNNLAKFELDENMKDLEFFESENIYQFMEGIVSKVQTITQTITFNSYQDQSKTHQYLNLSEQIKKNFFELNNPFQLSKNTEILKIKQELIILFSFLHEIVAELAVHMKILNIFDQHMMKNLDEQYLQDVKNQLKVICQMNNQQQSIILNQGDENISIENLLNINQQNENNKQNNNIIQQNKLKQKSQRENKYDIELEQKWNKFILNLILNSSKQNDKEYSYQFTRSVLSVLHQIELSYINNNLEIPSHILIQFNIILFEIISCIQTEEQLIQIFNGENDYPLIEKTDSTEYAYQVIFSNVLQQLVIKPNLHTLHKSNIVTFLYTEQFEKITPIQKLIYMSIFRQTVYFIINAINTKGSFRVVDYSLKQFFDNLELKYLQVYIAKVFYNQYKQGDIMTQKMKLSSYFQDNKWLNKYVDGFKGLLSSSFLNEQQLKCYNESFENRNESQKESLLGYLSKSIQQSQNVFGQIYQGNLNTSQYNPFMMNNNIYLFHRDSQNNTQLYQCMTCQEYIFSNACPYLSSQMSCLQCGAQIAKFNGNTKQVLQHAHKNVSSLEIIKQTNQWPGYYIQLEEDQINFAIDQGNPLDLRLMSLLYNCILLLSYQENNMYKQVVDMKPFNLKQNKHISIKTQRINQVLRIHYEANPVQFINEQIGISINHATSIMKTMHNISQSEATIIIFKIINQLLSDQTIQSTSSTEDRVNINNLISKRIQETIKLSQKVILETDTQLNSKVLENEEVTQNIIQNEYLNNLRITDLNMSPSFIQTYLKLNLKNNEYHIIKEFLDLPKINYISSALKTLVTFTQMVNSYFIKQFTKKQAQELTLLQALKNNQQHPIYLQYINYVIPIWKQIKEKEVEFNIGCQTHQIEQINEKTKLNNLIFCEGQTYGYFPNVFELLSNSQNNFINRIYQLSLNEQPKEFERMVKKIQSILVDASTRELKKLPIQNLDATRNVLKSFDSAIFARYFMCDIKYSKGFSYIQDLKSLQEELVFQVLSGAVLIDIGASQKFYFLSDINQIGLLSNTLIEQELASDKTIKNLYATLQNKTQIFELLQQLSTVFQIFKSEKNQANLSLKSALDQLQIKLKVESLGKVLSELKLTHLNHTIACLEELNMDYLVELCNPIYKVPLAKTIFAQAIDFINQTVTLKNFILALGRFILRCLSQEQEQINPKENLFSQLFYTEIYGEMWNVLTNVDKSYEMAIKYNITISQAYDLYVQTNSFIKDQLKQYNKISNVSMKNQQNYDQNQNTMIMENFSDKVYSKNIKDQLQ